MNFRLLISAAVISLLLGASSYASIQTVPDDLLPGAQYRLVFVTSVTRDATSSNIEDYNDFVNDAANAVGSSLAGLGATWNVIGSTSLVDARDNTGTNPETTFGVPIYLVDGTLVATNNPNLWNGSLLAPINVDEFGVVDGSVLFGVHTGTGLTGRENGGSGFGNTNVTGGNSRFLDGSWIARDIPSQSAVRRIYGISELLTAPGAGGSVPEPTSVLVWGLLGIGVVASRRHRKQAIHS